MPVVTGSSAFADDDNRWRTSRSLPMTMVQQSASEGRMLNANRFVIGICSLLVSLSAPDFARRAFAQAQNPRAGDPTKVLVARLDLEKYKATIEGLTQFGDREQGTDRNRAAVDWNEAQLKSYG